MASHNPMILTLLVCTLYSFLDHTVNHHNYEKFIQCAMGTTPSTIQEQSTVHIATMKAYLKETSDVIQIWTRKAVLLSLVYTGSDSSAKKGKPTTNRSVNKYVYIITVLLLISGDINPNPGPRTPQFPCGVCTKAVKDNQAALCCDGCNVWSHRKCIQMPLSEYRIIGNTNMDWYCTTCTLPQFTDSFLADLNPAEATNDSITMESEDDPHELKPGECFKELYTVRQKHLKNFIISHLNINSVQNKFSEIHEMLQEKLTDCLILSETKLDNSYPMTQFQINGYRLLRRDRTKNGGGLLIYIRDDIPSRHLTHFEPKGLETLCLEFTVGKKKWIMLAAYRPPSSDAVTFCKSMVSTLDLCLQCSDNLILIGDLNCDLLDNTRGRPLHDLCEVMDMQNLIKQPTCYKDTPSLLDVIITNKKDSFTTHGSFDTGLSDFHHCVYATMKCHSPPTQAKWINYRSFKNFDEEQFKADIARTPFHVCELFDDVNDAYWLHNQLLTQIINEHAPIKKKKMHKKEVPFMNADYRRAIRKKAQLRNKYYAHRTNENWELFRKQRNLCTNMRRKAVNEYFLSRCVNGPNNKDFWPTIKPFLSSKAKSNSNIILMEDKLIHDQAKICDIFNDFYINIAKDIGNQTEYTDKDNPSLKAIEKSHTFNFEQVTTDNVTNKLKNLKINKSAGVDNIPPKLLKLVATELSPSLTAIINMGLKTSTFPEDLKKAQVTPIYKKNDALAKSNYRPVSILPSLSKIYEGIIADQLNSYFNPIFSPHLGAFRKGYSCQSALLTMIEEWRDALDKHNTVGAVLMDLSKAFDCLPHEHLLHKLEAYGLSPTAVKLMASYLSNRQQRVKIGNTTSTWQNIIKGVPQGSILGPLLFNIFINDIFKCVTGSSIFNYADDNTLSAAHKNLGELLMILENSASQAIDWFDYNYMLANPDKFQALVIEPGKRQGENHTLKFRDTSITSEPQAKVLGVIIDNKLDFTPHIKMICSKAARQLNALRRLSRLLDLNSRMAIYKSFIQSNFNYCPAVWHSCGKVNTELMERIQHRALKFVFRSKCTYEELLRRANMSTLAIDRIKKLAVEVHKIIHQNSPQSLSTLVCKRHSDYNLRGSYKLDLPRVNTTKYGRNSFKYQAANIWNHLPNELRMTTDLGLFKTLLNSWSGETCKCAVCNSM